MKNLILNIFSIIVFSLSIVGCGLFGGATKEETTSGETILSDSTITQDTIQTIPQIVDIPIKINEINEDTLQSEEPLTEPVDTTTIIEEPVEEIETEVVDAQIQDSLDIAEAKKLDEERRIKEAELEAEKLEAENKKVEVKKIVPLVPGKTPFEVIKKYQASVDLVKSGNRQAAIEQFETLLSGEVQQDFADNCYYWIGESKFGLKDYKGALESFKKVFQFKISEKKDDSQYMIAQCFERLGNRKQAKLEFEKLVELYPTSELILKAEKRLK